MITPNQHWHKQPRVGALSLLAAYNFAAWRSE